MQLDPIEPPRTFKVGKQGKIEIRHCANIALESDEQVTFVTESGGEYDVVRKAWGFYATPSLNGRLRAHGFRSALVRNKHGKLYLLLVDTGKEAAFFEYLRQEEQEIVVWLDGGDVEKSQIEKLST